MAAASRYGRGGSARTAAARAQERLGLGLAVAIVFFCFFFFVSYIKRQKEMIASCTTPFYIAEFSFDMTSSSGLEHGCSSFPALLHVRGAFPSYLASYKFASIGRTMPQTPPYW